MSKEHYFSKTVPKGFEVYTKSGMLLKSGDNIPEFVFGQLENNENFEVIQKSTDKSKTIFDYLGKFARLAKLPNKVTNVFIDKYKESLEDVLLQQMLNHKTTLSASNKFIDDFMVLLFGNTEHYGIFDYLKMKSPDSEDKKLVSDAEKLIISGDYIQKDKGSSNYFLFESGQKTQDMTKNSDKEVGYIDSQEFFKPEDAQKLLSEVKQKSLEANLVYSPTELFAAAQTRKFTDENISLIKNYYSLDLVLRKIFTFPYTSGKKMNLAKLKDYAYSDKYTLTDKYSAVLKKDNTYILITRVNPLTNYLSKFEIEDELEKISGTLKQFQLVDDENLVIGVVKVLESLESLTSAFKNAEIVQNLTLANHDISSLEEDFAVNVLANLLFGEKDYLFSSDVVINPANMEVTTINHSQTVTINNIFKDLEYKKSRENILEAFTSYANFYQDLRDNFQLYVEKGGKKFIKNLEKSNLTQSRAYKLVKSKL